MRFLSVDPLAHLREWVSPYNYVQNNPIMRIDPDGRLDGDYYDKNGNHLGSDGINDNKAYIADSKNSDGTFGNAKLLPIGNKELLDRSTWVYGESSGSAERITVRTQNAGESSVVSDARVVDYYAHSINNAAKTDGGFYKSTKLRMGKMVDGKYTNTSEGYFEGKGLGGNSNSKSFANARGNGMEALMGLSKANNAISAVISSVNGGIDPTSGTRAWLGASAAQKYVASDTKHFSGATLQFSFSSGKGVFNHSFYKK